MAAARDPRRDASPSPARRERPAVQAVRRPTRVRATSAASRPAFRWDRVGRMALLIVLVGIVGLYVGPLHSYWSTRQEAQAKRTEVQRLQRESVRLRERRAALRSKGALQKEARRLGMVLPGERAYSVSGLPKEP